MSSCEGGEQLGEAGHKIIGIIRSASHTFESIHGQSLTVGLACSTSTTLIYALLFIAVFVAVFKS